MPSNPNAEQKLTGPFILRRMRYHEGHESDQMASPTQPWKVDVCPGCSRVVWMFPLEGKP